MLQIQARRVDRFESPRYLGIEVCYTDRVWRFIVYFTAFSPFHALTPCNAMHYQIFLLSPTQLLSIPPSSSLHLILRSRLLTRLQLIQIPPTNRQTPLVLIHARPEVVDVVGAHALRGLGVGHRRALVHAVVLGGHWSGFLLLLGGSTATAAEPAADGVADRGTDCYTAVGDVSCCCWTDGLER